MAAVTGPSVTVPSRYFGAAAPVRSSRARAPATARAATTASHLQNGQRPSQRCKFEKRRRKIVWAASSYSSRRPGPSTRATTARTRGVNFRANSSPAVRSPLR